MFQTNQLTALIRDTANVSGDPTLFNFVTGCAMLPTMTITYLAMTLWVLTSHAAEVPAMFGLILSEAFNPQAIGGGLMGVILVGVSRGAFSNEAGLGTEVMAHGAARTSEPIREGLVAMLGPVIDTLLVCTCTALVILLSGPWQKPEGLSGISMTMFAFRSDMGLIGVILLSSQVLVLSLTTMFTGWYYGAKCFGFLFGAQYQHLFRYFFLATILFGATVSIDVVFNLIIGAYGLMAIPTMTATLLLSGKVMQAANEYFSRPLQPTNKPRKCPEKAAQ